MKSDRARLADARMNATVRECEGDPMTQAGLEEPQLRLAVYRARLTSSCRSVQKIYKYILFYLMETVPIPQP